MRPPSLRPCDTQLGAGLDSSGEEAGQRRWKGAFRDPRSSGTWVLPGDQGSVGCRASQRLHLALQEDTQPSLGALTLPR